VEFGHYANEGAEMAADLVNTLGSDSGNEFMPDLATLGAFLSDHNMQMPPRLTSADLEEVRVLRANLREVFNCLAEDELVDRLNGLLEDSGTSPRITNHDGHEWHFHYVPTEASVARRLAATAAMGLAAVVCEFGSDRIGTCADDRCNDAFVDISRNRSRRYCSGSCSSRSNVAAYRARQKSASAK
jgi:predicted RNA-binding Zn ribbon-like protein